jgi:hypothetical protein
MTSFLKYSVLSLVALVAAVSASADQVTLKNGDRVTGSIVKKDDKNLTVKSDLMGEVTIPWDQVTEIKTNEQLNVVLAGQTAKPPAVIKAGITEDNGQITLSTGQGAPQTVAPAGIAAIRDNAEEAAYERLLRPGILQLWTGTVTLGLAGTAGNAQTSSFTTAMNTSRTTNHDLIALYFNAVKSSATANGISSNTAEAIRGGWKYGRNFDSRLDVSVFNDYAYDRFQDLDLRFVIGGGLGYKAWKPKKGSLLLSGGFDYDRDKFSASATTAAFTRTSGEVYWGDDFAYKMSGATSITQSARMFNNLSIGGEYRANFDLAANTKVAKWLIWNLAFGDHYLSDPVPGLKPNDILYTTGIGVTFGK